MTHIFDERTKVEGVVDTGADIDTGGSIDKVNVVDIRALSLLEEMLFVLKKIEYHLMIASETELKDGEV